jgi:Holliday junction resolvase RusA-like endonuclease
VDDRFDPITFEVEGIPAPQGSKTAVSNGGRARVIEGGSKTGRAAHRAWRQAVHDAACDYLLAEPINTPVQVAITFRFPMPKSRPSRDRHTGWAWHHVKPDLDKLVRATLDSLVTSQLLADDSRISRVLAEKVEITGTWYGAEILIEPCVGDWQ